MSKLYPLLALLALLVACGEDEDVGNDPVTEDARVAPIDAQHRDASTPNPREDAGLEEDAAPEADAEIIEPREDAEVIEPADAFIRRPNWVEVTLDPRSSLYAPGDAAQATARVYDFEGNDFEDQTVTWWVEPPGLAEIDAEEVLTMVSEGQGRLSACTPTGVCGDTAFFVDSAPPTLMVTSPARGAILGVDGATTIPVRGTAVDEGGAVLVWVNGQPVDVGAGGVFSIDLPARFGVNLIEVIADDGVRSDPALDLREVMWAPEFAPVEGAEAVVDEALVIRADQAILDTNAPVDLDADEGQYTFTEFAQLITALVALIDPNPLIGDLPLAEGFDLQINDLSLGDPVVDLAWVAGGMEIFLHFPAIRLETAGALSLEGASIDLNGAVSADTAAFVRMSLALDGGGVLAEVEEVGVNVESIAGEYADAGAQALIETLDGQLSRIIVEMTEGLISEMLAQQLPDLFNAALGQLFGPDGILSDINLDLSSQVPGMAPLNLTLSFEPSRLDVRPHETMAFTLDSIVRHPEAVNAPHNDPGVPVLDGDPLVFAAGQGFELSARLALINALLHEVWRAGLLQMPLPLQGITGTLDARLPPVVAPTPPGHPYLLEVQLGDMRMRIQAGDAPGDDYVVSIRVGVSVSLEGGVFELLVSEDPQFEVQLLNMGGDRQLLNPEGLAGLLESMIWPSVEQAIAGGMRFELPASSVPVDALQAYAPEITGLSFSPVFERPPYLSQGRLHLEGGLELYLSTTQ